MLYLIMSYGQWSIYRDIISNLVYPWTSLFGFALSVTDCELWYWATTSYDVLLRENVIKILPDSHNQCYCYWEPCLELVARCRLLFEDTVVLNLFNCVTAPPVRIYDSRLCNVNLSGNSYQKLYVGYLGA